MFGDAIRFMDKQKNKNEKIRLKGDFIPNYDHLFDEENLTNKKPKKKGFFKKVLRINRKPLALSVVAYLLMAMPIWIIPIFTANIINIVTTSLQTGAGITAQGKQTIIISSIIIIISIISNFPFTCLRWKISSDMNRGTSAGIKASVVRKLQQLSITYHKDVQSGRIQAKFLKDTNSVDILLGHLTHGLIPCIMNVIVAVAISVYSNGLIALFFLLIIPINVVLTRMFRGKIRSTHRDFRKKSEELGAKMNVMLEMMPVTKAHGLEDSEISHFNATIKDVLGSGKNVDKTTARFGALVFVVNELLSFSCIIFCIFLAINGSIGIGDIILYQSMFKQISSAVLGLTNLVPEIASGVEAFNSISEIMNATDIETVIGKKKVETIEGDVKFINVSYRYPDGEQDVVSDFSLDVKKGECIAVVGASGSGKSTLMNLIIGFMLPSSGEMYIGDKKITEMNLSEYRHNISVVPQNSILFPGTIKENITYGLDEYTEEHINKVVEMANIKEFLDELPNGLDTQVGEHGAKLSGGQKQRITIARALIRNPKILILDEATSALDNISEYHVQKAIASSIVGRTTFVVAHRLSTIRDANRIVVMEQGKIVECGTYEELMAKKGKFFQLKALNEVNLKQAEEGLA